MAFVAGVASSARGRRALDASLNLVPFIDLLSCCIAFLLITAVWSAVARIDVLQAGASTSAEEAPPSAPSWTLYVARDGWSLRGPDGAALPATRANLPTLLRVHSVGEPLVVRATDGVAYASVVDALDRARSAGIRVISLAGDGE